MSTMVEFDELDAVTNNMSKCAISTGKKGKYPPVTPNTLWSDILAVNGGKTSPYEYAQENMPKDKKVVTIGHLQQDIVYKEVSKHKKLVLAEVGPKLIGLEFKTDASDESKETQIMMRTKAIVLAVARENTKSKDFMRDLYKGKIKEILENPAYKEIIDKKIKDLKTNNDYNVAKIKGNAIVIDEINSKASSSKNSGSVTASGSNSRGDEASSSSGASGSKA